MLRMISHQIKWKSLSCVQLSGTQARILEWVAFSFSKGIFPTQGLNPGLPTLQADSFTSWATKEAHQVEANVKARVSIGGYKKTLISCNSRAKKAKVQLQDLITGIVGLQNMLNSQTRLSSMPRSWPQLENRILRHWMETSGGMHCCCYWVAKSCLTLCDPVDCSLPGSSVHGIFPGKNTEVGCRFLLQGNLPNPGIKLGSPALQADSLPAELPGKPSWCRQTQIQL